MLTSRFARTSTTLGGLWLAMLTGCAGPNQLAAGAPRIPFDQLAHEQHTAQLMGLSEQPVVIHFKQGQRVPLRFIIDSRLFTLQQQSLSLHVMRDFFLLLRADGPPLLSEDGVEFEERQENSFMFGFHVKKGEEPSVNLRLGIRSEQ